MTTLGHANYRVDHAQARADDAYVGVALNGTHGSIVPCAYRSRFATNRSGWQRDWAGIVSASQDHVACRQHAARFKFDGVWVSPN